MYALWTVVSIHAVKSHPVNDAIKFSILLLAGCAHDHLKMDKYSYAFRDYSSDTGLKRQLGQSMRFGDDVAPTKYTQRG